MSRRVETLPQFMAAPPGLPGGGVWVPGDTQPAGSRSGGLKLCLNSWQPLQGCLTAGRCASSPNGAYMLSGRASARMTRRGCRAAVLSHHSLLANLAQPRQENIEKCSRCLIERTMTAVGDDFDLSVWDHPLPDNFGMGRRN
ncbi:MAG: hypothetical protein KatS3mg054_0777 [Chloroflexus sp.]|nr:MAG: hypothetical protein KatS3mg054_0777 [Chloroflexus sp.]